MWDDVMKLLPTFNMMVNPLHYVGSAEKAHWSFFESHSLLFWCLFWRGDAMGGDAYLNVHHAVVRGERWPSADKEIHHLSFKTAVLLICFPQCVCSSPKPSCYIINQSNTLFTLGRRRKKKAQPKFFSVIKRAGQTLLQYTAFVFRAGPFHCECVCDPSESFMMNRCVLHEVAWTVRRSL